MILLLTTEAGDLSHIEVVNWLIAKKADYIIMTREELLSGNADLTIHGGHVLYNGIDLTQTVRCVYYRRWIYPKGIQIVEDSLLNNGLVSNLFNEAVEIKMLLANSLTNATWIPKHDAIAVNKPSVLSIAKQCDLLTPDTIVTTEKSELLRFSQTHRGQIITKAIGNYTDMHPSSGESIRCLYTKRVTPEMIGNLPLRFVPTLFQQRIEKSFELRIFFFMDSFFVTGIMSQDSTCSVEDSRISDGNNDSKLVPMDIHIDTKTKLSNLMHRLDLNIGSIDMIVDKHGDCYFLEVNPVGQISGYSRRTGQNIEEFIADKLIAIDNGTC